MKKEKDALIYTAILFIAVGIVAQFIWHSWCLYSVAVLTGYGALMLLTAILKKSTADKKSFYKVVFEAYFVALIGNMFISTFMGNINNNESLQISSATVIFNVIVAVAAYILMLYCCERKEWKKWLKESLER